MLYINGIGFSQLWEEKFRALGRLLLFDRWGLSTFETVHRTVKQTYWTQTSLNQFSVTSLWAQNNGVFPTAPDPALIQCTGLEIVKYTPPDTGKEKQPHRPYTKTSPYSFIDKCIMEVNKF